ncbi:efflux RND transporter permease subunit [Leptospira sp. 'Mane']|uniref:efflux RND transporter permease subunit n=1 Tax=Leptospira sp. 'Mane' TaxID=3387407 RepID=UPI00398B87A7
MLFGGLLALGFISLPLIPVSLMPNTENPAITIITRHAGISPSKIEESLTKPMEEQINGVGGIESIYSSSEEGESRINVLFDTGQNIAKKSLEIRSKIDLIRSSFSREVEEPVITRYDPSDKPIFIIKLESQVFSLKELRDIAEYKLKKRLERIDGISEIQVGGGYQREININIDRGKMNFLKISIESVMGKIRQANITLPTGKVETNNEWVSTRVIGKFGLVEEIKETVLRNIGNQSVIKLKDIAEVSDGFRDIENISRENGKEIVTLYIQKAGDANILTVCEGIKEEIGKFEYQGLTLTTSLDQSEFIKSSIDRVSSSALVGGLVAVVILLLFLRNLRATIIIATAIPLSIFITFFVLYNFKLGLNIMSMSGLALGIGVLIDNSIVILDRIFFLKSQSTNQNYDLSEAPIQLGGEVFASTLTNIAVFFPIFLGSFELKQLYGGLAYTVSFSMLVSFFCSLFFLPVMAKFLLKKDSDFQPIDFTPFINKLKTLPRLKIPSQFTRYKPKPKSFNYRKLFLRSFFFILKKQKIFFGILFLFALGSVFGIQYVKTEYLDPMDSGEIRGSVELESGTHLTATNNLVKNIEDAIRKIDQVAKVSSKVEKWHADLYISLKPASERNEDAVEMIGIFKEAVKDFESAFVYFVESGGGETSRELDVEFIGDETEILQSIAKKAASQISSIPEIQESVLRFRDGKGEVVLDLDIKKSGTSGISSQNLGSEMKTMLQGSIPSKFLDKGREVDIRVRYALTDRMSTDQVINYHILNEEGKNTVPIKELVTVSHGIAETRIYRKNKRKIATITAKIGKGDLGGVSKKIEDLLNKIELPPNYYFEFGKNLKKLKKNQTEMMFMVCVAIFLIYAILASLFQDYIYPALILITIPLALIGIILILLIFGLSLNISVYIGIIMLCGIVVNNGIMLVDQIILRIHSLKNKTVADKTILRIVAKSTLERLRPILMTTLTTILALFPSLIDTGEGSQLWRPLSITVFFGLSISTILTVYTIPILFLKIRHLRA